MADLSNLDYLYASNANVSNFVSVKLSGKDNYHLWKAQMLCLMESHDMSGIVYTDTKFEAPKTATVMKKYNSLLKGWIFGSVTEDLLVKVANLDSAKDVWEKLKSTCEEDSTKRIFKQKKKLKTKIRLPPKHEQTKMRSHQKQTETETETEPETTDSAQTKLQEAKEETKGKDAVSEETETETNRKGAVSRETEGKGIGKGEVSTEMKANPKDAVSKETASSPPFRGSKQEEAKEERKKKLRKATMEGDWWQVKEILLEDKNTVREELNSDGNTVLHLAVGIGTHKDFVKRLLNDIRKEEIISIKNNNGSTALHVAAIVGNREAAELLVNKNENLLLIPDNEGQEPLLRAASNMHFDTFMYLYHATIGAGKTLPAIPVERHTEKGIDLLVNAISAKEYSTALKLIDEFPEFAVKNDDVLMAMARTFPSELTKGEKLIYPSLSNMRERIIEKTGLLFLPFEVEFSECKAIYSGGKEVSWVIFFTLLSPVLVMIALVYHLMRFLMLVVYLPFFMIYFLSWKVATKLPGGQCRYIEMKRKEWIEANKVLKLLCQKISEKELKSGTQFNYNRSILEAACQNASPVVEEILYRSPDAIKSTDKNQHDIIQLAVINRSEKVYNLLYEIWERKSHYKTLEDCSGNNILHLASRLAPSHELNRRTGAALQLQRELQWREEVEKLVFPTFITKENIFKETPDMVFTREHANLIKEGEAWMKTTAESCSITAALITTIVFAAAITVPGGSDQQTGIPLFTKDAAFTVFAISDAISLFTSSTSLLAFLSILTARFAEQDFLVTLPRRLIVGLYTLLLSATTMMVAFSATLFLVFCHQRPWMIAPICGLACLPIGFFFSVQFPLIVDLFRLTYRHPFGMQTSGHTNRFNPDVRGFFNK